MIRILLECPIGRRCHNKVNRRGLQRDLASITENNIMIGIEIDQNSLYLRCGGPIFGQIGN